MIQIKNLVKNYGHQEILTDINISFPKGCIYGLLGKNGAGKTTLLNSIMDIIPIKSGEISIMETNYTSLSIDQKKKIGFMGEDLALIEELNAKDYLNMIGKIYGMDREVILKRQGDLFSYFFENEKDLKKNLAGFSTGMKKKIAFCAAIMHTPEIVILDEPFSGLDPVFAIEMINFLKMYKNQERTIIISSHDLSYIEKLATHIMVIDEGKIRFDSSIDDFTLNGKNSIGDSLMNMLSPNTEHTTKLDWI
jgi:ABC-2 type transport system ATP-binding protein